MILAFVFEKYSINANAEMYQVSNTFIRQLGGGSGGLLAKVTARSLRPLKVHVGRFYFFKKSTFTTYLATVVDYTMNVLIAMLRLRNM